MPIITTSYIQRANPSHSPFGSHLVLSAAVARSSPLFTVCTWWRTVANPKKSVPSAGLLRTMGSSMSRLLRLALWASSLPMKKHRYSAVKRQTLFLNVYRSMAFKTWSRSRLVRVPQTEKPLALVVATLSSTLWLWCVTLQANYSPRLWVNYKLSSVMCDLAWTGMHIRPHAQVSTYRWEKNYRFIPNGRSPSPRL